MEFISEVVLDMKGFVPENQIPGGTFGFEEEEKHLEEKQPIIVRSYTPDTSYKNLDFENAIIFNNHISEIPTPLPNYPV